MKAGFDFGSKNIHYAVLDKTDLVLSGTCAHNGNISKAYESILCEIGDSQGLIRTIQKERDIRSVLDINLYQMPDSDTCEVYIGIDVGSTSTKAVVTDTAANVLAGLYSRTKGDPVQAVTDLLAQAPLLKNRPNVLI